MLSENRLHVSKLLILNEEKISWQLQNKIHQILNVCFDGISVKFISKTYGHIRPAQRVVGFLDEELVAHLGIVNDVIILESSHIKIACLGLWVSTRHGWAAKVMQSALNYLKEKNVKLALGISNNEIIFKKVLPKFNHVTLDICIKGKNYMSKAIDKSILFPISIDENEFSELVNTIKNNNLINIEGEPF